MLIDESIDRVRSYAKDKGLKPAQLAALAGLHPNTLRHLNTDDWSPTSETLRKLEAIIPLDSEAAA